MKYLCLLLIAIVSIKQINAQTLKGSLKHHAEQEVVLTGFNYYKTQELSKTVADSIGNFTLHYPKGYRGMAVLKTQDNSSLVLVLTAQNIRLKGNHLKEPDSLVFANSTSNTNFMYYAKAQGLYTNSLSAWRYLDELYQKEHLFSDQKRIKKAIKTEQKRIKKEDADFVASLNKTSYVRWFIPYRKLLQDMPTIAKAEPKRIPEALKQFRTTDFNNPNFKTSGLFKELIEGHYFLLENMGQSLDSVYTQMNISTDYLIKSLQKNDSLLNTVSEKMFTYFEKRSLYPAAAHLATQMLSQDQGVLSTSLANTMQKYKDLKVGAIAPDLQLDATTTLSSIKKPVLLVFGESGCTHCKKEALELLGYYDTWKTKKNIEVVYISLDTDKELYNKTNGNTPWQTYCNFKGWETQAAKDYFVNATPTYILLDKDLKILVHPKSLAQVDTWVHYKL